MPMTYENEIKPWLEDNISVTAIVLNWKRLKNLKIIVRQLSRRQFISEILIWNNNPQTIDFNDLGLDKHHDWLTIVNSQENLRDEAKYLAASQAKNEHIFYQDDDWSTAHYINAMYAAYCINPTHLHVVRGELSWAENQFCSFHNEELGLQSEFFFIGCGAIFPKHFAEKYLKHIRMFFEGSEKEYADVAFTMFLNQPIVKLQAALSSLSQDNAFSFEDGFDDGLNNLKQKVASSLIRFKQKKMPLPHYLPRSVYNDLILFTSYLPKEIDQSKRVFNPDNPNHIEERLKRLPSNGASSIFRKHPYFNAIVDLPTLTERPWLTQIRAGDEWGVLLLRPKQVKLKIKQVDGQNHSSLWDVTVDGNIQTMTLKELMSFNELVHTELRVTCVDTAVSLMVKIEYVNIDE